MQLYGKHISRKKEKKRNEYEVNERNLGMWEESLDHPTNVQCMAWIKSCINLTIKKCSMMIAYQFDED